MPTFASCSKDVILLLKMCTWFINTNDRLNFIFNNIQVNNVGPSKYDTEYLFIRGSISGCFAQGLIMCRKKVILPAKRMFITMHLHSLWRLLFLSIHANIPWCLEPTNMIHGMYKFGIFWKKYGRHSMHWSFRSLNLECIHLCEIWLSILLSIAELFFVASIDLIYGHVYK